MFKNRSKEKHLAIIVDYLEDNEEVLFECLMSQLAPIRNKGSNSVMAPNDAEYVESHLPESNWRPALYEGANDPFSLGGG